MTTLMYRIRQNENKKAFADQFYHLKDSMRLMLFALWFYSFSLPLLVIVCIFWKFSLSFFGLNSIHIKRMDTKRITNVDNIIWIALVIDLYSVFSLTQTHTHAYILTQCGKLCSRDSEQSKAHIMTCSPKPSNDIHELRGGATGAALLLAAISHTLEM